MSKVYILGGAQTDFERNWKKEGKGMVAILKEVMADGLTHAGLSFDDVRSLNGENRVACFVGNFIAEKYQYQKVKTVFGESSAIKDIANLINDYSPDIFLAGDEAILTSQVIKYISDGVRKYITVHDVTPHPVEFSFRRRIVYTLARVYCP